ncbi:MAG TPA: type II 3-dehydroquinate dehydratase [Candidatus Limiplasma sp.]|nr:type II 3-dehydroquinate dehydratase [Candidatus Limiplasma sp.]HRX08253.1 type II 3-dehydroquinate dehydratase [Candidatus Limiplasma sp.]
MKLLVINGPNLNMLGIREPDIYGHKTYADLVQTVQQAADARQIEVSVIQSNHEGKLVDIIQDAYQKYDGIIINPAAYTHTSVAILDALKAVGLPAVEVHLSDIHTREPFRQHSYISPACLTTIAGKGFAGYVEAMDFLANAIQKAER